MWTRAQHYATRAAAEVIEVASDLDRISPRVITHAAHGIGHGITLVSKPGDLMGALELCHTASRRILRRFRVRMPSALASDNEPGPWIVDAFRKSCVGGVFHTAWNSLTADELREMLNASPRNRQANASVATILCERVYPLPAGYDGPLVGTECGAGTTGLDEADARLELVRLGACAAEGEASVD